MKLIGHHRNIGSDWLSMASPRESLSLGFLWLFVGVGGGEHWVSLVFVIHIYMCI